MEAWRKIRLGDACVTNADSYSPKEEWKFVNYLDTGNITDNRIDSIQYIDVENDKLPAERDEKSKKTASFIQRCVQINATSESLKHSRKIFLFQPALPWLMWMQMCWIRISYIICWRNPLLSKHFTLSQNKAHLRIHLLSLPTLRIWKLKFPIFYTEEDCRYPWQFGRENSTECSDKREFSSLELDGGDIDLAGHKPRK